MLRGVGQSVLSQYQIHVPTATARNARQRIMAPHPLNTAASGMDGCVDQVPPFMRGGGMAAGRKTHVGWVWPGSTGYAQTAVPAVYSAVPV